MEKREVRGNTGTIDLRMQEQSIVAEAIPSLACLDHFGTEPRNSGYAQSIECGPLLSISFVCMKT